MIRCLQRKARCWKRAPRAGRVRLAVDSGSSAARSGWPAVGSGKPAVGRGRLSGGGGRLAVGSWRPAAGSGRLTAAREPLPPGRRPSGGSARRAPAPLRSPDYAVCLRARIRPTCSSAPGPAASSRVASAQGDRTIASSRWSPSAQRGSYRSSHPATWGPCSPYTATSGKPSAVAEALLNHAKGEIEATYNLYTYWAERKAALALWHEKLAGLQVRATAA